MNNFISKTFFQASVMPLILGLLWCFHCPPMFLMKGLYVFLKLMCPTGQFTYHSTLLIKHLQYAEPQVRYL